VRLGNGHHVGHQLGVGDAVSLDDGDAVGVGRPVSLWLGDAVPL
jgi:hypothetical protein